MMKFRSFAFRNNPQLFESDIVSDEHFKDVRVNLPPGFIGNPTIVPQCTAQQLVEKYGNGTGSVGGAEGQLLCPVDSQVGVVHAELSPGLFDDVFVPMYNMVPPPGVATELGFNIAGTIVLLDATLRPGDHGISILVRNTTTTIPVIESDVVVWGAPSAPSHDWLRGACDSPSFLSSGVGADGEQCPSAIARPKAFLRMPTSCTGKPLAFEAKVNSYEHPDNYIESTMTSPPVTGCDLVPFDPGIRVAPTGSSANSPTGVSVRVSLQQNSNPEGLQEADLKKAVVTLPEGMALNPSAADGLQACTDAQLRVD